MTETFISLSVNETIFLAFCLGVLIGFSFGLLISLQYQATRNY